jgi:hypothetical protein
LIQPNDNEGQGAARGPEPQKRGGPEFTRAMRLTAKAHAHLARKHAGSSIDQASCAVCGDVLTATGVWHFGHLRMCGATCVEQAMHGSVNYL